MTCEEFKAAYNTYLDGALSEGEARLLAAHPQQCQGCAAYRDSFASLDADLRRLPTVAIPAQLVRNLEQLPHLSKPGENLAAWRPELLRVAFLGLPAIVAFVIFGELPNRFEVVGNSLLAFAGTLVFLLSILRPFFLPGPSLPGRVRRSSPEDRW